MLSAKTQSCSTDSRTVRLEPARLLPLPSELISLLAFHLQSSRESGHPWPRSERGLETCLECEAGASRAKAKWIFWEFQDPELRDSNCTEVFLSVFYLGQTLDLSYDILGTFLRLTRSTFLLRTPRDKTKHQHGVTCASVLCKQTLV